MVTARSHVGLAEKETNKKETKEPRSKEPTDTAWSHMSLADALIKAKELIKNINNEPEKDFLNDSYVLEEQEQTPEEWEQLNSMFFIPTPKSVSNKNSNKTPIGIMKVKTIQNTAVGRPLVVLYDSGSDGSLINGRTLPKGVVPIVSEKQQVTTTANGTVDTSRSVWLEEIRLPEFANNRCVKGVQAKIFDSPTCRYDVILGRDFLRAAGIKLCFSSNTMQWWDRIIDMKTVNH